VIVLPPADGQAEAERARVRMLVERAATEALPSGPAPVLLEPASSDALDATVEAAVRRVGAAGTVCLIGADGAAVVAPVLALYPAARVCLLPASQDIATTGLVPPLTADVDLERLGRELGAAARAAAGSGDVRINLYGYFNGVDPGGERLRIWLTAVATDVPPADLAGLWNERFLYEDTSPASLEVAQSRDAIDADPATWERIATSLVVPRRARFVLLHCSAVLPAMPGEAERLPRYYADDISVVVTPVATSNNDPEARRPPGG
jgi:hypothetical protein